MNTTFTISIRTADCRLFDTVVFCHFFTKILFVDSVRSLPHVRLLPISRLNRHPQNEKMYVCIGHLLFKIQQKFWIIYSKVYPSLYQVWMDKNVLLIDIKLYFAPAIHRVVQWQSTSMFCEENTNNHFVMTGSLYLV